MQMTDRYHVRRRSGAPTRSWLARVSDRTLDELLRSLPPAPEAMVARAIELSRIAGALGHLEGPDGQMRGDARSLRTALEEVGLAPDEGRVRSLALLRRFAIEHERGSEKSPAAASDVR
jgi:hypothetical protein